MSHTIPLAVSEVPSVDITAFVLSCPESIEAPFNKLAVFNLFWVFFWAVDGAVFVTVLSD